ncbi:hypothetical protein JNB62_18405 [Microbacterium jejuense]|uniref:Uncharacterized protein n=1 Tax=Microbacterium jejuense TaxID=1263637 RepID=A0ABS7HRQ1_9MICO|nr:hypothetical protein [Microbacterium jejuense]MBW9095656.1 hypothetical protein [Microbacterium jejuense]
MKLVHLKDCRIGRPSSAATTPRRSNLIDLGYGDLFQPDRPAARHPFNRSTAVLQDESRDPVLPNRG